MSEQSPEISPILDTSGNPFRAGTSSEDIELKEVAPSPAPDDLASLLQDLTLFVPSLLPLTGAFDKDPIAYIRGKTGIDDLFELRSEVPLMRLSPPLDRILWAVPHEYWPKVRDVFGTLNTYCLQKKTYARFPTHTFQLVDQLQSRRVGKPCYVPVQSFAVDSVAGYYFMAEDKTSVAIVRRWSPRPETLLEAKALWKEKSVP